jgi:N-dimethylarginine dimethylaminohydrolase
LGDNEVLANSADREVIKQLERARIKVNTIDLYEFAKGRGGASCLILPIERK